MDNLLPLLLIGILYLVPALWRRFVSKKYTQIHLPEQVIVPELETSPEESRLVSRAHIADMQMPIVALSEQTIPIIGEEPSTWQGKLTEERVINGLIFSEILQPPRAYRPFIRRMK
jgi:hypothetical protein